MSRTSKTYRPKKNFLCCRFCIVVAPLALHRNSRPDQESIKALEAKGWAFTGRDRGRWSGICPDCNLLKEWGTIT